MQQLNDLALTPVWLTPSHRATSARVLMEGHLLKVLPVMNAGDIVGMVTLEKASEVSADVELSQILQPDVTVLDGTSTLVKAAQVFVEKQIEHAVVVDRGQLRGVVTVHTLLRELRRTWDPLTGLGWSDRLREWGCEMLTSGREITILFIDINQFGEFNKRYGHIVGDRVLQRVAQLLRKQVDGTKDVLVRYGGDEFAIGSPRPLASALELREELIRAVAELPSDEGAISFSVGISGGRRLKIREDAHVPSMLDELINAASRDALARKPGGAEKLVGQLEVITAQPETPKPATSEEPQAFRPKFDP